MVEKGKERRWRGGVLRKIFERGIEPPNFRQQGQCHHPFNHWSVAVIAVKNNEYQPTDRTVQAN